MSDSLMESLIGSLRDIAESHSERLSRLEERQSSQAQQIQNLADQLVAIVEESRQERNDMRKEIHKIYWFVLSGLVATLAVPVAVAALLKMMGM